jgi:hypothetical protein
MTTTARMTTATMRAVMARTTAMMAATATALAVAVARSVGMSVERLEAWLVARSVAWLVAVFFALHLHTVGIVKTCFGINSFWSKLVKMIFGMSGQVHTIEFILFVLLGDCQKSAKRFMSCLGLAKRWLDPG